LFWVAVPNEDKQLILEFSGKITAKKGVIEMLQSKTR
jgi:hypothetical protein